MPYAESLDGTGAGGRGPWRVAGIVLALAFAALSAVAFLPLTWSGTPTRTLLPAPWQVVEPSGPVAPRKRLRLPGGLL